MILVRMAFLLFGFFPALLFSLAACEECAVSYKMCEPKGASLRDVPVIGPDLGRLYLELLYTVKPGDGSHSNHGHHHPQRGLVDGKVLCCMEGADCLLTQSFHIALCWDKFTTNYFLTDGSFGSLANGTYMTSQGDEANLITGEYRMRNGQTGNIYDQSPADKPDTSDLPMPTPFTSTGVGSAIPGSALGATATGVTTDQTTSVDSTSAASSTSPSSGSDTMSTPSSTSAPSTTGTSVGTITSSITIHSTATYSVTAGHSTGGGYGGYNTTLPGPTVTGTSGASVMTAFTSSPITPYVNIAAARFLYHIGPTVIISIAAAMLMG